MHENEPEFDRKIIMSDEAHFHLGGYVNKQNCRIWSSENPKMIIEKPLFPPRVTIGVLREKFTGQEIFCNGDYNWPLRSCDLTPPDFFLWGYIRDKLYADAP